MQQNWRASPFILPSVPPFRPPSCCSASASSQVSPNPFPAVSGGRTKTPASRELNEEAPYGMRHTLHYWTAISHSFGVPRGLVLFAHGGP